jgi:putative glutamine amidotransferase
MSPTKKPIIGITLDLAVDSDKYAYAKFPWYALRQNYADSVIRAGGVPLMTPYQHDNVRDIVNIIDGLLIPGGDGDVPPSLYGQENIASNVFLDGKRAVFEIELVKAALDKNIALLGICNGMQILNVVMGGDLIQDIPNHKQPHPHDVPFHPIEIKENTLLSRLSNAKEIMVNSNHHQAIGNLGAGLIVSATAKDGIIEAIELPGHKFVLGVEWHPEYIRKIDNGLDANIFENFIRYSANN